jgi:hypothetical protein
MHPDIVSVTPALRLGFEAQTDPMVLWPNHQTPRTLPGLTTPSVEPAEPFTSGARTVYSGLPRSLTWPLPMHRLHVHDFVLLFLHHAART